MVSPVDLELLRRAVKLALEAEELGNVPVGALLTLDGAVVAEGRNAILVPHYVPGRHAEMEALASVPPELWPRAAEMTCYTTLEPCLMCFGALLLHGVGRVVFGARDELGGAGHVLPNLPPYYGRGKAVPDWVGPALVDECLPLYRRVHERFRRLPCGGYPPE